MKYFILIFISLITLFIITSCGLIHTTKVDKEEAKFAKEYSGLYVFDKKLRDEIIQRKKEREEYSQNRLKTINDEKEKILRSLFTEKEIQDFRDMVARDRKRRVVRRYFDEVYEKENEILRELNKKYPDLTDSKFPQTLSNGNKYGFSAYGSYNDENLKPYYQKIKEYMGEEVFEKLSRGLAVTSYYVDKNGKEIPITMYTFIYVTTTTYGIYGDEGAGVRFTSRDTYNISNDNIFYFINGKFIKSNDRGEGATEWHQKNLLSNSKITLI